MSENPSTDDLIRELWELSRQVIRLQMELDDLRRRYLDHVRNHGA